MQKTSNKAPLPVKLTAPKVGKVAPRKRLFRRLDAALDKPVLWISAPAGAGKTTLVASYLAERRIKPLWYRLDARDADPATFFAALRQAAGKRSPRKHEPLPLLTPEYALGLPVFALNFFEQLFARLRSPAVLVLDNFQDLPESAVLQELLAQVAAVLPEGVTLIFVSRAEAPPAFARMRAGRQMAHIEPQEMLLSASEARQLANCVMPGVVSGKNIAELNERAGGWAAGLILLLEGAEHGALLSGQEVDADVFGYFAAEIMRRAEPEIQEFLYTSALLPVMDVGSTAALTGNGRASAILQDLVRRNYFISRHPGDAMRYEFHPLFRDFLLAELHSRTTAQALRTLQQRAGQILAEGGEYTAAVELLSRAGAVAELVTLVLGHAERLVADGRFLTLERWLQAIPDEAHQAQPWLAYWLGVSRLPHDLGEARRHFEQAYAMFSREREVTGLCMSWVGIVDSILNILDSFYDLDPWIDAMDRLVDDFGRPGPALATHIAPRMYGALGLRRPHHPQFEQWKVAALEAFHAEQNASAKLLGGFYLLCSAVWADDFAAAEERLAGLREIGEAHAAMPAARVVRELSESWLAWLKGRPLPALRAAEAGLEIGQQSGVRIWEPLMLVEALVSVLTASDLEQASAYLDLLRPMQPHSRRWDRAYFYHESGWHAALSGDYAEAQRLQASALQLMSEMGGLVPEAEVRVGMAQAYALAGKRIERDEELEQARRIGVLTGSPLMRFSTAFVGACYALDDGDEERAAGLAAHALSTGSIQGYRNFTWWLPQQAARLCAFALEQGIEPDYARELIRTRDLVPPPATRQEDAWPWPVRLHALGHFSLIIEGKPVALSGRAKTKVIDMLKAIIAFGGRDVAEQHLCDLLWPDAEGDLARQSFKVTLHRLRKLLGAEVLLLQDGRLTLNAQRLWLDTWAFERLLTALENAADDGVVELACEATERYRGGFLQDEAPEWALAARERIRNRYLRVIGTAAERLCSLNQWQAAISCYQRALETEPLAERFYAGLMQCHYLLGQAAEGLLVYRRCREALANGLDISPSAPTEELHDRLRSLAR